MATELLWDGPDGQPMVALAHGAGSPMDSDWMNRMSALLADRGIRVVRFEFGYMAARRRGQRGPPPRAETLIAEYRNAVADIVAIAGRPIVIGGKSMGGRVASMAADELRAEGKVAGLVCLGYPFHPPGSPERTRTAHLEALATPALIFQGTRDPFGAREEVAGYPLSSAIRVLWLEDGDHELRPRAKLSGFTHAQHLATAADALAEFARAVTGSLAEEK